MEIQQQEAVHMIITNPRTLSVPFEDCFGNSPETSTDEKTSDSDDSVGIDDDSDVENVRPQKRAKVNIIKSETTTFCEIAKKHQSTPRAEQINEPLVMHLTVDRKGHGVTSKKSDSKLKVKNSNTPPLQLSSFKENNDSNAFKEITEHSNRRFPMELDTSSSRIGSKRSSLTRSRSEPSSKQTERDPTTRLLDFYQQPYRAKNASNEATNKSINLSMLHMFSLTSEAPKKHATNSVQNTVGARSMCDPPALSSTPVPSRRGMEKPIGYRRSAVQKVNDEATKKTSASVTKRDTSYDTSKRVRPSAAILPSRDSHTFSAGQVRESTHSGRVNGAAASLPNGRLPPPPAPSKTIRKFYVSDTIDSRLLKVIAHEFRNEISSFKRHLSEQASSQRSAGSHKPSLIVVKLKLAESPLTGRLFEDVRRKICEIIRHVQRQKLPTPIFNGISYGSDNDIRIVCEDERAYNCLYYYLQEQQLLGPIGMVRLPQITTLLYWFIARYDTILRDRESLMTQIKLHHPRLNTQRWIVVSHEVEELRGYTHYILIVDERSALDIRYHFKMSMFICMHTLRFLNKGIMP